MTSLSSGAVTTTEPVWEGGRLALERDSNRTTYRYVYDLQRGPAIPGGTLCFYVIPPVVIDEHIDGHKGNTSYGGEYLY